jgi:chromosome segregation ATPase
MDKGTIVSLISALGLGLILRQVVSWILNRGKVAVDQAWQIREEIREQIKHKNAELKTLADRIDVLEAELEKARDERAAVHLRFSTYKLDVYRSLNAAGAPKELLDAVIAIP